MHQLIGLKKIVDFAWMYICICKWFSKHALTKFNPKLHLYQTWKYKGTTKMAKKKCAKNVRTLGDKISVQIISIQKIYKGRDG